MKTGMQMRQFRASEKCRTKNFILLSMLMLCVSVKVILAQNVNYSQYRNTPFYTNPALLGSKSELSLSVLHRSQQLTDLEKYNTSSVSAIVPLVNMKTGKRQGGWGFSAVNDELKGGLAYRTQGVSAAFAYNLPVSKRQYISFGMQGGYFQRKFSADGLTTSSQWIDNAGFDPRASSGETFTGMKSNYVSLGAGALFYADDDNSRRVAQLGVAAFNVNKPNASFTSERDLIPVKVTALGSIALLKSDYRMVSAEMLFYHENGVNTYHVGARASHYFNNDNPFDVLQEGSIDLKLGYRVNNAITMEVQFHQPNFTVGLGYDFGVGSRQARSNNNGTFEVLFILKKFISGKKTKEVTKSGSYSTIGDVREFYFSKGETAVSQESPENGQAASENRAHKDAAARSEGNFEFKLQRDFKFGFNDATLNDDAKAYLDDMVSLLNKNKNFMLEVIGHTDNIGTHAVNRDVSLKRANVVISYLVAHGIDEKRLRATPMGAKQPVAPNDSEDNRSKNRRVEFIIRDVSAE